MKPAILKNGGVKSCSTMKHLRSPCVAPMKLHLATSAMISRRSRTHHPRASPAMKKRTFTSAAWVRAVKRATMPETGNYGSSITIRGPDSSWTAPTRPWIAMPVITNRLGRESRQAAPAWRAIGRRIGMKEGSGHNAIAVTSRRHGRRLNRVQRSRGSDPVGCALME